MAGSNSPLVLVCANVRNAKYDVHHSGAVKITLRVLVFQVAFRVGILYFACVLFLRTSVILTGIMSLGCVAFAVWSLVNYLVCGAYHYRQKNALSIKMEMRRRGLCASCAYSMEGILADVNGMQVCPECAAVWRDSGV